MKPLCYSKYIFTLLFISTTLFASLYDKSAMLYYGKDISYPTVGVHDYIIVNPQDINTIAHGFDVYKTKMYARVILSNQTQKSSIDRVLKDGFINIYFDTEGSDTQHIQKLIIDFHKQNPHSKIIVNAKLYTEALRDRVNAILQESNRELTTKRVAAIKESELEIIYVKYLSSSLRDKYKEESQKIEAKGMTPYVTNFDASIYGVSSKNAIKREIFTLIDESKEDRTTLSAHRNGATPTEYLGYVQKLYNIHNGLPDAGHMRHYAGVVIWLRGDYENPGELVEWVLELKKLGIKVAFVNNFGFSASPLLLKPLDIDIYDGDASISNKKKILYQDEMIGYEIDPSLGEEGIYIHPNNAKKLLVFEDSHKLRSTPAAITQWGGYVISEAFMHELGDENVWVINPFEFFRQALRLEKIVVPDTTTHNGNRIFFTHVDGDGMVSLAEFNPELLSGDVILEDILKVYSVPHSISIIGAEVSPNGLFPQYSKRSMKIAKDMYALENVEAATHTFTHPFIWGKIENNKLDEKYRLKPKNYEFSLESELSEPLKVINEQLIEKDSDKNAQCVFWSGDCAPRLNALEYTYRHNILNMNGGDTEISNVKPWLTMVAPIGLQRGDYYQVYTGAQNENVFTNDWLGPFWGFKRVVQTYKLTNSPRRLKPIDIYYHLYSGSKLASLNALRYVFDWSLKQEIFPMYASEYIPKAMDYFTVSMAREENRWLVSGMRDLKTLRLEDTKANIDFSTARTLYGVKEFENHTYISLGKESEHFFELEDKEVSKQSSYLVSSNAKVLQHIKGNTTDRYIFKGYVDLRVEFHLAPECKVSSKSKYQLKKEKENSLFNFRNTKEATVDVICR